MRASSRVHLLRALEAVVRVLRERAHDGQVEAARDVRRFFDGGSGIADRCFIAISTGVSPVNGTCR